MKKLFFIFLPLIFSIYLNGYSQSCCGGSIYDVAVLSLQKKALFNVGFNFDNYSGVWNENSNWQKISNTSYQIKPLLSTAYRFNKQLQAGVSVPFVFNRNELPGLKPNGSGFGDISVNGRYELLHEYQIYKSGGKDRTDKSTPYLALTFGLTFPTGRSDETALTEAEITGKGYFATLLGISVLKSIVKNKFQVALDLGWQHGFKKTYNEIYGQELTNSFTKSPGERYNYGLSFNYIINDWHAVSLSAGGFYLTPYKLNDVEGTNSDEHVMNFTTSYTYYPAYNLRITPSFKWFIPSDNYGKNTTGSLLFAVNLVYYIENLDDY